MPNNIDDLGLLPEEQKVNKKLMECYQLFLDIERQHPDELRDFVDAVHHIQGLLALRVVRRSFPKGWSTYGK